MCVEARNPFLCPLSPVGTACFRLISHMAHTRRTCHPYGTQKRVGMSFSATNMPFLRNFQGTFRSTDLVKNFLVKNFSACEMDATSEVEPILYNKEKIEHA
jgi:hypothetical protein